MAGESARAVAIRQLVAPERAAAGRTGVAEVLASLPEKDWRVFDDVPWPGRRFASVDHVVIGRQGVFAIDANHWSGEIDTRSGGLRQDGRSRGRAVASAAAAASAVGGLLPELAPELVRAVICVDRPEPVFGWADDVMVCSTLNLARMLTARPAVFSEREVHRLAETLIESTRAAHLPRPRQPRRGGTTSTGPATSSGQGTGAVRFFGGLVVLVALVLLFLRLDGVTRLSDLGERALHGAAHESTASTGHTFSLGGGASRPPLDVTAVAPLATRSLTRGVHVRQDHVLLAVTMTVRNRGDARWVQQTGTSVVLRDSTGATYRSAPRFRTVRAGRVLPQVLRLRPGQWVRGAVVFDVPRSVTIDQIRMTVGPEELRTLRWSVGG